MLEDAWAGIDVRTGDVRVERCRITDCDNGLRFFESKGVVTECDITKCINGIMLSSASPRIIRSQIYRNTAGIRVKDHSDPSIGGSLGTANRIYENSVGQIRNEAYKKENGLRTLQLKTLKVPYNYWGTDCATSALFHGPVEFVPWVDETGKNVLEECAPDEG